MAQKIVQIEESRVDLPTPTRRKVDPDPVTVPDGFTIEPFAAGLTYPSSLTFDDAGALYVCEGGSAWPPRPFVGARILRFDPSGDVDVVAREDSGPLRHIEYHDGYLYAGHRGIRTNRILRFDLTSDDLTGEAMVDDIPSGGFHPINGPVFDDDGYMYFNQGSVSLNGVNGPEAFMLGFHDKHPGARDVPGEDITLTGHSIRSSDPTAPFPLRTQTGPFKPFGEAAEEDETIEGQEKCTTGVFRSTPHGDEFELLAWGVRNGWGMAFDEQGELYVSDFCMEDMGIRPIGQDPGRIWHVRNASESPGSIQEPDWYGFPDFGGDGKPVTDEKHTPERGRQPKRLIKDPPELADTPVVTNEPHAGVGGIAFDRHGTFGSRGDLFLCQFGTWYPMNTPDAAAETRGFNVGRIDVESGETKPFVHNEQPGPASLHGTGGLERPVDCAFAPDGEALYVLDVGRETVTKTHLTSYGHTGVLWRVTPERTAEKDVESDVEVVIE